MKTVFVDPERCIGCKQCEVACAVEHSQSRELAQAAWETPLPKSRIHVQAGPWLHSSFANKCRHCDPAPCELACPTGAINRDHEHELVLVDDGKCIACATCAMVCSFDAVTFHAHAGAHPERIVATKCDGCLERMSRGAQPACVEACKSGALLFGELNELVAQGRERRSVALLTTLADSPSRSPRTPAMVQAWRSWGAEVTELAEGATHDRAPTD